MVTDFHCHILPGMDDGSASAAESIEMLQMQASQGVRHVIATPHFYPQHDSPDRFLEHRGQAEQLLRQTMCGHTGLPTIHVGAEVFYFPGMSHSDALQQLTLGGTRYILIEMPTARWTDGMYRELAEIPAKQGLTPIIAHVDRYIAPFATHGIPKKLADLPVLVQANATFFLRRATAPMSLGMLRRGMIHLLGSDCHNLTSRPPNLRAAVNVITRRLGEDAIAWIRQNEREVLSNFDIGKEGT